MVQQKPPSVSERVMALEGRVDTISAQIVELKETIAKLPAGKPKGLFGGKRQRTPIKDTTTGITYLSKSHAGQQLAHLVGGEPTDHFVYYKLVAQFPDRFVEATPEEAAGAEEFWKPQVEEEGAESTSVA